jgi:hypothetical protein
MWPKRYEYQEWNVLPFVLCSWYSGVSRVGGGADCDVLGTWHDWEKQEKIMKFWSQNLEERRRFRGKSTGVDGIQMDHREVLCGSLS